MSELVGVLAPNKDLPILLLTGRQAAAVCAMSLASWYRKIAAGLIGPKPVRIGRGCVRYRADELKAWVAAGCPERTAWQALQASKGNGKSQK
jgi:predicted DNA-binding transcriptional regulator AlpA